MSVGVTGFSVFVLASLFSLATGAPDLTWFEKMLSGQIGVVLGAGGTLIVIYRFVRPSWVRMIEAQELVARALAAFVTGSTNHTDASKEEAAEVLRILAERKAKRENPDS